MSSFLLKLVICEEPTVSKVDSCFTFRNKDHKNNWFEMLVRLSDGQSYVTELYRNFNFSYLHFCPSFQTPFWARHDLAKSRWCSVPIRQVSQRIVCQMDESSLLALEVLLSGRNFVYLEKELSLWWLCENQFSLFFWIMAADSPDLIFEERNVIFASKTDLRIWPK